MIAQGLLELETLDADQFRRLFEGEPLETIKEEYEAKMAKKKKLKEEARKEEEERRRREEELAAQEFPYSQMKDKDWESRYEQVPEREMQEREGNKDADSKPKQEE